MWETQLSLLLIEVASLFFWFFFSQKTVSGRSPVAAFSTYMQGGYLRSTAASHHEPLTFITQAHTHIKQLILFFKGKAIKIKNKSSKMSQ